MNKLIKPKKLNPGDTVATISLSWGGAGLFPCRYNLGKSRLKEMFNLNVVETKHALQMPDWLYQHPKARADDLMEAFLNPKIKAIFSIIGGDDSIRLLPYIDYKVIQENPKIFLGFSDTTITHFTCRKAGLTSFYGPAILTAFSENVLMHQYTIDNLKKILFSNEVIGNLIQNDEGWTSEYLDWSLHKNQYISRTLNPPSHWRFIQGKGKVKGHLIGGCVEVLTFINGTEIWPCLSDWNKAILFLETSEAGMPPVQLEWFLRNLGAQKILPILSGILFSKPGGSTILPSQFIDYDESILKVLKEYDCNHLHVVTHLDFGHTDPMMIIPYGLIAEINAEDKQIAILENSVE